MIIYLLIYVNTEFKIFSNLGVIFSIVILYLFSLVFILAFEVTLTFLYKRTIIHTKKSFLKI